MQLVQPTHSIRNGFQMECVGCTSCIDACDQVMVKIGQPVGLIRYDSERGFGGQRRQFWRPRVWLYLGLSLFGLGALTVTTALHRALPVSLFRQAGPPYVLDGARV